VTTQSTQSAGLSQLLRSSSSRRAAAAMASAAGPSGAPAAVSAGVMPAGKGKVSKVVLGV
jgi:hypothetical protein